MKDSQSLEFGLMCEFRNPKDWARPFRERVDEVVDAAILAEELGYDAIQFTEHHFYEDEYISSPLLLATLAAYRTKSIRIGSSVLILPLYNPVRLAEDAAFIDNLSNGRYELGFGVGYRPEEFNGMSIAWQKRGERTDEAVEIIRRLWEGEEVTFHGNHFQVDKARLHPKPVQQPRPPILVGGFSKSASKRAARYDGLLIGSDLSQNDVYEAEVRAAGRDPASAAIYGGKAWTYVSETPEETWNTIAPYAMYHINYYAAQGAADSYFTQEEGGKASSASLDAFRAMGVFRVISPDEMIEEIKGMQSQMNLKRYLYFMNTGMAPMKVIGPSVELFAKKVIPAFR